MQPTKAASQAAEPVHVSAEGESQVVDIYNVNWDQAATEARADKRSYQEKLEGAGGHDVFKYVFLINSAAVEQYVSQSRGQAQSSFDLSRKVAIAGFSLLVLGVVVGLVAEIQGHSISIAYLSGIGGVLTQFIAGVFFWLYNRTLQQINLFYQGMMTQQHEALTAIGRASDTELELEKSREITIFPAGPDP